MTTIIGIESDHAATIMADNRVTDDSGKIYGHPDVVKVTKTGQYLIAGSGEVLPCDIAQHSWKPPRVTVLAQKNLYKFMVSKVMPSLRKCLKDNGYNFDGEGEDRFQFLIAVCGQIFEVDDDLGLTKTANGIYSIGSGSAYALGALAAGATMKQAMEISSELTAFTSGPYITMIQKK
jgi:hypothetical protein